MFNGHLLAHEFGHRCGLDDEYDESNIDRIMYHGVTSGDGNLLSSSEINNFK